MMKVIYTDSLIPVNETYLSVFDGMDVKFVNEPCETEEDFIQNCADADGLLVLRGPITAKVVAALKNCKVISRLGIGLDMIDVDAARHAGITVANVPDAGVDEVSTHAVAMILSLVRRLPAFDRSVRDGEYRPLQIGAPIRRTSHMTVGMVGLGRIGAMTARKLSAFGFTLWGHDPYVEDSKFAEYGVVRRSLDDIIAEADIVSIHVPLTPETRNLFDDDRIQAMKQGAMLINVSRGAIVDEAALARALQQGKLAAAGLDAFAIEPLPQNSPLCSAPGTLLSPHSASLSQEALFETGYKAFANVAKVLAGPPVGTP